MNDSGKQYLAAVYDAGKKYVEDTTDEIIYECVPTKSFFSSDGMKNAVSYCKGIFHIPYSPAFTRPGWLINLIFCPKDTCFFETLSGDIFAGFTVGMTAIPQALSYGTLAGLHPINGLYAMIFPSVLYIFLGSSMQLSVGPSALVSLLMGELVTKYGLNVATDPVMVVNFAAECTFCSGLLMLVMGLFNLGMLIRFISYPVMSGFTTASAMIIGLNLLQSGFGFPSSANVPLIGESAKFNYEIMQWYVGNWNGSTSDGYLWRNVHATNITFGVYVPLILLRYFKVNYPFTEAQKKTTAFQVFNMFSAVTTLVCLIIASNQAYQLHNFNDTYHARTLRVVGTVPPGLDIFRIPSFPFPLGQVFADVIPITIIAYMESFSVSRKMAAARGQLSDLNASQELVAIGLGNMVNAISSGYIVTGTMGRSALNASCGARTLLAKTVTLVVILVALATLTEAFYFIPQAALAAVVMVAIAGLIDFHEFWVAWKLSKKDFFVMIATFTFTFVFETQIGLGVGVGLSIILLLKDLAFSLESKPISTALNFQGVEVIRLNSNLVFVSAATIKDTLVDEILANQTDLQAIVIDFIDVKHADLSGLLALKEVMDHADKLKLAVFLTNVTPEVQHLLTKSNIHGANISECSSDLRDMIRAALMASTTSDAAAAEYMQVESLGLVQELLRVQSVSGRSRSNSQASVTSWSAAREQHTSHRNSHLDSIHSDSDSGRESEEEGGDKGGVEMKDIAATVSSSSSSSAHGRQNYSKVLQQGEQGSVDLDV